MFKLCAIIALIAIVRAQNPSDAGAQITNILNNPNDGNGVYSWSFDTSNGISQQESGSPGSAQGSASWRSPEGELIQISYIADQFGYRAASNSLPTPPPIPEAILRSLEYIPTHPSAESQPQQQFQPQPLQSFQPLPVQTFQPLPLQSIQPPSSFSVPQAFQRFL